MTAGGEVVAARLAELAGPRGAAARALLARQAGPRDAGTGDTAA